MKSRHLILVAVLGIFLLCGSVVGASRGRIDLPDTPNILIIIVDDMGYADLSAFAHAAPDITTPQMDRLATDGTLFTRAYVTAPVCSPSRAGWNYGRCQWRWGGTGWGPGVSPDLKHLARYLKEAGYVTGKVGKNDYGTYNNSAALPLNHGYDEFLGFNRHAHDFWLHSQETYHATPDPDGSSAHLGPMIHNGGKKPYPDGTHATDIFTDEAIDFMTRHQGKRFFLTLSYNAVHHLVHEAPNDYLAAEGVAPIPDYNPYSGQKYSAYYNRYNNVNPISSYDMRRYYRASLRKLDDGIGQVLDALDRLQLTENTLIFFFGDNGGSPRTGANNAPLTGGKYALHEGGLRVPFMMRWPGQVPVGRVSDYPISTLDIVPTCLAAAGVTPEPNTLEGFDLLPALDANEPAGGAERAFVFKWQKTFAIIQGDWKLTDVGNNKSAMHTYIAPTYTTVKKRLFNLKDDLRESVDLIQVHPEKAATLQQLYNDIVRDGQTNKNTLASIGAVVTADSEELEDDDNAAVMAIDGDPATIWHTEWGEPGVPTPYPHWLQADCLKTYTFVGISYLPRASGSNGRIKSYTVEVGMDGQQWTQVASGNWPDNASKKEVRFNPVTGRYIRIVARSGYGNNKPHASAAEFDILLP